MSSASRILESAHQYVPRAHIKPGRQLPPLAQLTILHPCERLRSASQAKDNSRPVCQLTDPSNSSPHLPTWSSANNDDTKAHRSSRAELGSGLQGAKHTCPSASHTTKKLTGPKELRVAGCAHRSSPPQSGGQLESRFVAHLPPPSCRTASGQLIVEFRAYLSVSFFNNREAH